MTMEYKMELVYFEREELGYPKIIENFKNLSTEARDKLLNNISKKIFKKFDKQGIGLTADERKILFENLTAIND